MLLPVPSLRPSRPRQHSSHKRSRMRQHPSGQPQYSAAPPNDDGCATIRSRTAHRVPHKVETPQQLAAPENGGSASRTTATLAS
jgi:hypothetical protein